jgi:hypothetical protein
MAAKPKLAAAVAKPARSRNRHVSKRTVDPKTGLTPAEEIFAAKVAAGEMLVEALIAADPARLRTSKRTSIGRKASEWMKRPAIKARVAALQSELRQESRYTLRQVMAETDDAIKLAKQEGNPGAYVSAVALRAKVNGLMVEDRKNERRPYAELSEPELDAEIERAINEIEQAKSLH